MFLSGSHRYNCTFNYKKCIVVASVFSVCCEIEHTSYLDSPRNERHQMQEASSTAAPLPLTDGLHFWNTCVSCSAALLSKGFFPQLSVSVMSITRLGRSVMADWRRRGARAAFVILSFFQRRRAACFTLNSDGLNISRVFEGSYEFSRIKRAAPRDAFDEEISQDAASVTLSLWNIFPS